MELSDTQREKLNLVQELVKKIILAASDLFDMFTKSFKV